MKIVVFCDSFVSDWGQSGAHFLRGVVRELGDLGHEVHVHEPRDGASRASLLREHGPAALDELVRSHPGLSSRLYTLETLDLDRVLDDADVVLVEERSAPEVVARLGVHRRRRGRYALLFHGAQPRVRPTPDEPRRPDLRGYDGALVPCEALAETYQRERRVDEAWVWHAAADHRLFRPLAAEKEGDLVFVGNWGDGRLSGLREFLIGPARSLGLSATVHGVRYPGRVIEQLTAAGVHHHGWLPNGRVPGVLARHRATVHLPNAASAPELAGIPSLRVFEALACGIPLVSAPWDDCEGLFREGDFLVARDGAEATEHLRSVLAEPELARLLARRGRYRILERHTCLHRAHELLAIAAGLGVRGAPRTVLLGEVAL